MKDWMWVIVGIVMMLIGSYLGVNKYKNNCEPMGTTPYKVEWLECKP